MIEPSPVDLVEENLVDGCAGWSAWAEAEVHRTGELAWTITPFRFPLFNVVLRARLRSDGLESSLAAAVAPYRQRDLPFAWWVTPSTRPAGLGERLEACGLVHAGGMAGMAADLSALRTDVRDPAGLAIEEVTGEDGLERWCAVQGEVHGLPDVAAGPFFRLHAALGLDAGSGRPWRLFLGSLRGRAVATSASFHGREAVALTSIATRREARGRGIAAAMSLYSLLRARAAGCGYATACASPAAEPLLRRLGFTRRCQLDLFLSDSPGP
jgi:ribosomal protein S18 acetylase RimI-like enzyme